MKVATSSEIDLNSVVLAIIAKVGPITVSRSEFMEPVAGGKPIVGFRVDVSKDLNTLTFHPMPLDEMVGAIQEQMLSELPTTTSN